MECFVQCSEPQPIRREMRSTLTLGFSKKLSHLKAVALPMADNSRNPGQTTPKRSRNMPSSRRGKNPHWGGPGNVGHSAGLGRGVRCLRQKRHRDQYTARNS